MDVELSGVYGEGGVYGDEGTSDVLQENMNKSYRETISEICTQIDQNMAYINQYVEGLKGKDQSAYITARKEFLEIGNQYRADLTEAMTTGEQAPDSMKKTFINNLRVVLDYTNQNVENIKNLYVNAPPTDDRLTPDQIARGANPIPKRNKKTVLPNSPMPMVKPNMGQYMGEIAPVIQMTNVGPLRAWWNNLNPNARTFIKVGAIAAAIFGGEYLYKKWKASRGETVEVEEEE